MGDRGLNCAHGSKEFESTNLKKHSYFARYIVRREAQGFNSVEHALTPSCTLRPFGRKELPCGTEISRILGVA